MKYLKPALTAATLILVGGTMVGCGGAPTDASEDDFCTTYADGGKSITDAGDDKGKAVDAAHEWADKLEDTGTPEGISDGEREGFEILVDAVKDVDEGDIDKGADDLVTGDDADKVEEFGKYVGETCADQLAEIAGVPTDMPTDLPTDVPTDLPTDVPTDLPTDLPTEVPSS